MLSTRKHVAVRETVPSTIPSNAQHKVMKAIVEPIFTRQHAPTGAQNLDIELSRVLCKKQVLRPPLKRAGDVSIPCIPDADHDDDEGNYKVVINAKLTNKYKILDLLGEGGYGTVVRACKVVRDCKVPGSNDVAIKISAVRKGRSDAARKELRILETIKMNDERNQKGCIRVQECFEYRGHICMVMDLLGQSTCEFLEQNNYLPYPKGHIQSFARQLFNSVAFLHDLGIVHADIKPENLVLCDHTYCTLPYHRVRPSSSFVRSEKARYAAERRVLNNTEVRLIDFGIATFMDEPPSHFDSTAPYCAPETWIYHKASFSHDIWSIGCTLVEFFTGDILFDADDMTEYIAMTEAVTGLKFEEEISWITDERFRHILSALLPKAMQKPRQKVQRMSMKHLDQIIAPGDDPFLKDFADLLKRIFVVNPEHRITAKQALQHPCLTEIAQPDNDTLAAEPNSASNLATP
ncbi:uncharacterized protein FPRO_14894 [Fusarium proliferatum ET1]|uniref:Related to LAMMER kinase-like protein n=1 Tax=Fusarium proliferatum (strain ET1) TaxID=1227346 RepID=A0A1L7WAM1_FUSPR|nr:uncharacterized protein FPRO_14894 [Fusarium proliferatum ET1]CZR49627.1 related to LAMMER kinase-like protein [Fusarium proliferatum ET1]